MAHSTSPSPTIATRRIASVLAFSQCGCPRVWRKRLGEYQAVKRDPLLDLVKLGNVALAHTDGLLYFRYRVPGWLGLVVNIAMKPVSDTELVISGTGWLMGETVQVVRRDGREALRYSGYEFRRIGTVVDQ